MIHNHSAHTDEHDPEQSFHPPEGKTAHYVPNDILFYVEHDPSVSLRTAKDFVNEFPDDYRLPANVVASLEDVPPIYFPPYGYQTGKQAAASAAGAQPHYSLFCIRSPNLNVFQEYKRFYGQEPKSQRKQKLGRRLKNVNATIQHVLPNWFGGMSPHDSIGGHGPGGPPRAVTNPNILNTLRFGFTDVQNLGGQPLSQIAQPTASAAHDVVVYILDTIPDRTRIQNAVSNWPLLKKFEKILVPHAPGPVVGPEVYNTERATYLYVGATGQDFSKTYESVDTQGHHYAVGNHDYDSSDHGLFIAGIVHSIAPTAIIYVIQVLNEYGVGTFLNYAAGLDTMRNIHENNHSSLQAIVNCSFTMSIPIDGHDDSGLDLTLKAYEKIHEGFEPQMQAFEDALKASLATGAIVLAAAGNDSHRNQGVVKVSRYPAKFDSVVGVGALKGDRATPANYSNEANKPAATTTPPSPPREGIYVFGGDYVDGSFPGAFFFQDANGNPTITHDANGYPINNGGIISVFTGNLNIEVPRRGCACNPFMSLLAMLGIPRPGFDPDLFFNPTGYAEWKGTSFATPVLAGTIAQMCAVRGVAAEAALQEVYGYRTAASSLNAVFQTHS